jgi:hypothetical protein
MEFDIRSTQQGRCENCGNVGRLLRVPVVSPQSIEHYANPPLLLKPSFEIQLQCLGCVEARSPKDVLDADTIE